jgi:hypothetical protein
MKKDFYIINMQKTLYIARELHQRGFETLYIEPSMSPSGCHWRCSFFNNYKKEYRIIISNWIQENRDISEKEISQDIIELTELFIQHHQDFLTLCKGKNSAYVEWYQNMLNCLTAEELPYAYADFFHEKGYWMTTKDQKIPIFNH